MGRVVRGFGQPWATGVQMHSGARCPPGSSCLQGSKEALGQNPVPKEPGRGWGCQEEPQGHQGLGGHVFYPRKE